MNNAYELLQKHRAARKTLNHAVMREDGQICCIKTTSEPTFFDDDHIEDLCGVTWCHARIPIPYTVSTDAVTCLECMARNDDRIEVNDGVGIGFINTTGVRKLEFT